MNEGWVPALISVLSHQPRVGMRRARPTIGWPVQRSVPWFIFAINKLLPIHCWMNRGYSTCTIVNRVQTELKFLRWMKRRKMEYAGHALRGSSDQAHIEILEGRGRGKEKSWQTK